MRRAGVGLVVLVLAFTASPAALAGGGNPQYTGGGEAAVPSVEFKVKRTGPGPGRAIFKSKVGLFCDDDTFREIQPDPIALRFTNALNFEGSRYTVLPDGSETYYKVRGHLLSGGRAKGFIVYFLDAPEAPVAGGSYQPDCKTTALHWKWEAKRK